MSSKTLAVVAAAVLFGAGSLAFAGGNGHGNGGGHDGGAHGANHASGDAAAPVSSKSVLNSNGRHATDRDKGHERATDRHRLKSDKPHHHSKTHTGSKKTLNSNGLKAADHDKGQERAADRHSLNATKHDTAVPSPGTTPAPKPPVQH